MDKETVGDDVLKSLKSDLAQKAGWEAWPDLHDQFQSFKEFPKYCAMLSQDRLVRLVGTFESHFVNHSPRTML